MTTPSSHLPLSQGRERSERICSFFSGIAGIYDFFNHFFSGGIDILWRRFLIKKLLQHRPKIVLDLATGSGDIAKAIARKNIRVIGADFCIPMLEQAQKKGLSQLVGSDALHLPFPSESFDAVTIAFGLRNLVDREQGLSEMFRVLKPGGQIYILEFSTPKKMVRPLYYFYLSTLMPWITEVLFKQGAAYLHLNDSIRTFPNQTELCDELSKCGFLEVEYTNLTFGISALHKGWKAS